MNTTLTYKRTIKTFIGIFACLYIVFFMLFGETALTASKEGLAVFHATVLPAILPFGIAIAFLRYTFLPEIDYLLSPVKKRLNLSQTGLVSTFFGVLSGYPVGTKTAVTAFKNGKIDGRELFLIVSLTALPSPLLTVTCIGKFGYKSLCVGVIMFLSQVLATTLAYKFFASKKTKILPLLNEKPINFSEYVFANCSAIAVSASLTIFFYTVVYIAFSFFSLNEVLDNALIISFFSGLIETNYGCNVITLVISPTSVAICNFILTLGGLPILLQNYIYLKEIKIRTVKFFKFKLLQSLFCFIVTFLSISLFYYLPLL